MAETSLIRQYLSAINAAASALRGDSAEGIVHITDTDADGIVACLGIDAMVKGLRKDVTRVFLERPFENAIKNIYARTSGPVILTDHGGGNEEMLARYADGRITIILDHHGRSVSCRGKNLPANIHCLNCECWGIQGDDRASASTITYLLARKIVPSIQENASIFLLGSLGDGNQKKTGTLHPIGIDDEVLLDAAGIHRNSVYPGRPYTIDMPDGDSYDGIVLANHLTMLGCKRELNEGALLGLDIAKNGLRPGGSLTIEDKMKQHENNLVARFRDIGRGAIDGRLKSIRTNNIVYIQIGNEFSDMNLKVAGACARHLVNEGLRDISPPLHPLSYIMVAMPVAPLTILGESVPPYDDDVPRLKVSIRTSAGVREKLLARRGSKMPSVCHLVETFMPGSGHNSHDERGAGIIKTQDAATMVEGIQRHIERYNLHPAGS